MKNLKNLVFILAFVLVAGCSEDTIDTVKFGTIQGTVTDDATGEALSGVKVTTSPASSTEFTNSNGNFVLNNVPVDDYSVQAELDNYVTAFEPVTVLDGVLSEISFELLESLANNQPPSAPVLASPEDGAVDVPLEVDLIWSASDPEGDDLSYSINFRNSNTNEVQTFAVQDTMFTVENLQIATSYFWQVTVDDGINSPVSSEISEFSTLVIPDNPFLFVKNVQGNNVIFSGNQVNDDGGQTEPDFNVVQLTDDNSSSYRPRKNLITNKIAFLRNVAGDVQLFTMDFDGTNVDQVTGTVPVEGFRNDEVDFAWAEDGSRLYYPNFNDLYSIQPDGTDRRRVYSAPVGIFVSEVAIPEFDSDLLLLKTNNAQGYDVRIFTYRISTETEEVVIFENKEGAVDGIDIDANSERVLYTWDTSESENANYRRFASRLFSFNIPGMSTVEIETDVDQGQNDLDVRFSPDEGSIIFVRTFNNNNAIPSVFRRFLGNGVDDQELFTAASMPDWE